MVGRWLVSSIQVQWESETRPSFFHNQVARISFQLLFCHSRHPFLCYLACHCESSRITLFEKSVFTKDIKLITVRLSGHPFPGFMRSFHSKGSLACHAVKWWVWGKTSVCICVSAPDICIYLYICILFVQINVSSDEPYSREPQKELVQFKSKWNISQ